MIISPPFLPPRNANEADDAYVARAMPPARHGRYPIGELLGWHGGLHLAAPPGTGNARLPVRAIADGTVAFVRQPTATPDDPDRHALGYHGWTDDGCVVLRHDTAIGADGDTETTVRFFSIYLHLGNVLPAVRQGEPVRRKTEIGRAGMFGGEAGILHFEIVCDDANLRALLGRNAGDLDTSVDGRTDAVFGELYFRLPATTPAYPERPALDRTAGAAGTALGQELFIGLAYGGGNARVTSYRADGSTLGAALVENDAEYNLYRDSGRIVAAYRAAGAVRVPAHSAVYELLRFGRALGPDVLDPGDTPHWRQIHTPSGLAWVNLNAAGTTRFSDADAPHWAGWHLLKDYRDGDSRCSVAVIRNLLDANADGVTTSAEAQTRLRRPDVQRFLRGVVAKFPTEWNRGSVATRWAWLKQEGPEGPNGPTHLTQDDFPEFQRHAEALAFWEEAALEGIGSTHWHFHPARFIEHFRKCGWLSPSEIRAVLPHSNAGNAARFATPINMVMRKYLGSSLVRRSHFLGQMAHETGNLGGTMAERGNSRGSRQYETDDTYFEGPDTYTYFQPAAGYERIRNTLGNEYSSHGTGDGIKFRGRGSLQITGRAHYSEYWVYRGWLDPGTFDSRWWARNGWWDDPRDPAIRPAEINDPQRISARLDGNEYNPIDVGGDYWVRKSLNQAVDPESPSSSYAPRADNASTIINRYDRATFNARRRRIETAKRVLCDET